MANAIAAASEYFIHEIFQDGDLYLKVQNKDERKTIEASNLKDHLGWPKVNRERLSKLQKILTGQTVLVINDGIADHSCLKLANLVKNSKKKPKYDRRNPRR